jgi:hypothetical protein
MSDDEQEDQWKVKIDMAFDAGCGAPTEQVVQSEIIQGKLKNNEAMKDRRGIWISGRVCDPSMPLSQYSIFWPQNRAADMMFKLLKLPHQLDSLAAGLCCLTL